MCGIVSAQGSGNEQGDGSAGKILAYRKVPFGGAVQLKILIQGAYYAQETGFIDGPVSFCFTLR